MVVAIHHPLAGENQIHREVSRNFEWKKSLGKSLPLKNDPHQDVFSQ